MKQMKPVTMICLVVALLGGCRADYVDGRLYAQNPQPIPRHCRTDEDRQMPSGVCVRRPVETYDHIWRRDRKFPWIAGGNPRAREYFDQQDSRNGGSHNE